MKATKIAMALACAVALTLPVAGLAATGASSSATTDKVAASEDGATKGAAASQEADAADAAEPAGPSEELLAWADTMECGACHADQAASVDDEELTAHVHGLLGLDCVSCHADDALIEIHEGVSADSKLPKKLKKSELAVDTCKACHANLVEATTESAALTDSEGTVVNPHEIPDVKDHKKIGCASCHKMHAESKPSSTAPMLCVDCHHEDVYECYTCHS